MTRIAAPALVFAVALATQALAQPAAQPATPGASPTTVSGVGVNGQTNKPAKGSPDEVLCKRQEETGSRLGSHKTCYTRAQWDEQSRLAHDDLQRAQQVVQMPH